MNLEKTIFEDQMIADGLDYLYFIFPKEQVYDFFRKPDTEDEDYFSCGDGAGNPLTCLTLEMSTATSRFDPDAKWRLKMSMTFGSEHPYDDESTADVLTEERDYKKDDIKALLEIYFKHEIEILSQRQKNLEYTICPRCGGYMDLYEGMSRNAISRRANISVCSTCGTAESIEGFAKAITGHQPKPYAEWDFIKKLKEQSVKLFDLYVLDMYRETEEDEEEDSSAEPSVWDWTENSRTKICTVYIPLKNGEVEEEAILACLENTMIPDATGMRSVPALNTAKPSKVFCVDPHDTGSWWEVGYRADYKPVFGLAAV